MKKDDNCMLAASADQLKRLGKVKGSLTAKHVGEMAVAYLRDNRVLPGSRVDLAGFVTGGWEDYLRRMAGSGEWGDHVTLMALPTSSSNKCH
ncbi:uncharacterized protein LOC144927749 isoform X1 [Branchiostoma floridae x Branchiostoma belcheri]